MSKRLFTVLCILALTVAMIPAAFGQDDETPGPREIQFNVNNDYEGIDIKLEQIVADAGATSGEGHYEFSYLITPLDAGGKFKIATEADPIDPPNPAYVRYTDNTTVRAKDVQFTLVTNMSTKDTSHTGPVPAADIVAAAGAGQNMRISQFGTTADFLLHEITVTHIVGTTETVLYRLSEDADIRSIPVNGTPAEIGATYLVSSGNPAIVILAAEAEVSPSPSVSPSPAVSPSPSPAVSPSPSPAVSPSPSPAASPSPSPSASPSPSPSAAPTSPQTGVNTFIPIAVLVMLLTVAGAFIALRAARKGHQE